MAMMNDQNLSMFLWGEATMAAVYVQIRSPHRVLKDMTPEEAFSRKKSVEHLRIFGYPVYVHVPKEKRKKLDPSGKKGIFVGYNESSKSYRIYIPGQHKIEVSRDVTFNENISFRKSIEDSMHSNEEEKHEATQEESTGSLEHLNEEPPEPVDPVDVPKIKKRLTWLESTLFEE
jgi:hypothetical protein